MKKWISLVGIVLSLSLWGQDQSSDKAEIISTTNQIMESTMGLKYQSLLDLTYPRIYEMIPKEQMVQFLKMMFEGNEEFSIKLQENTPEFEVSEIFEQEGTQYAFVNYPLSMTMRFENEKLDENQKSLMKTSLSSKGMTVKFVNDQEMEMYNPISMQIMIKDSFTDGSWKGMNFDSENALTYSLLPSYVIEDAEKHLAKLRLEMKKQSEKVEAK